MMHVTSFILYSDQIVLLQVITYEVKLSDDCYNFICLPKCDRDILETLRITFNRHCDIVSIHIRFIAIRGFKVKCTSTPILFVFLDSHWFSVLFMWK